MNEVTEVCCGNQIFALDTFVREWNTCLSLIPKKWQRLTKQGGEIPI